MAALAKNVSSLFLDRKYAGLEIRCEGKSFSAHRLIVGTASKVLDKECSGGFLETTRIIEHRAFSADTLERMFQFIIYRVDYVFDSTSRDPSIGTRSITFTLFCAMDDSGDRLYYQSITAKDLYRSRSFEELRLEDYMQAPSTDSDIDALEQHVFMYAIGDYCELPDLKQLAVRHFRREKSCLNSVDKDRLVRVITTIYTNNAPSDKDDLRQEVMSFCIGSKHKLLGDSVFAQAIVELAELQDFTAEFLVSMSRSYESAIAAKPTQLVMPLQVARVHAQITELQAVGTCRHVVRGSPTPSSDMVPRVTWPGAISARLDIFPTTERYDRGFSSGCTVEREDDGLQFVAADMARESPTHCT